eukprot:757947-Hanusia_phi.AAC.5
MDYPTVSVRYRGKYPPTSTVLTPPYSCIGLAYPWVCIEDHPIVCSIDQYHVSDHSPLILHYPTHQIAELPHPLYFGIDPFLTTYPPRVNLLEQPWEWPGEAGGEKEEWGRGHAGIRVKDEPRRSRSRIALTALFSGSGTTPLLRLELNQAEGGSGVFNENTGWGDSKGSENSSRARVNQVLSDRERQRQA